MADVSINVERVTRNVSVAIEAGIPGPRGARWRGAWSALTAYVPYDLVEYSGSTWISILAGTNQTPPLTPAGTSTYWELFAAEGTIGSIGSITAADVDFDDTITSAGGITATNVQDEIDGIYTAFATTVIGLINTLDTKVDENAAITGATKTKITYDAKGLVIAGADATTADIADSTNKRYVTDAQQTIISNTSGVNTGDQNLTDYFNKTTDDLDDLTDGATNKAFTSAEKTKLSGIATGATLNATDAQLRDRSTHTGTQLASTISDFSTAADARITAQKGAASGIAPLDGSSKISSTYLPAYVDDVLEYANLAAFPVTGTTSIIYVAIDTNKVYRWSGSAYVEISPSPGSTDAVPEGSSNLYYTNSRADARIALAAGVSIQAYSAQLLALAGITFSNDDIIQYKSGALTNRTMAQLKTDLALTKSDVALGNVTNDAQLKIASNLSDLANAATARTNLGLAIGTNVQQWNADLDIWATKTAPSGTVVGTSDTQTISNKRRTPRVYSTTSTATLTPEIDTYDCFTLTAQAAALNIANHSTSTPSPFEKIQIRILDNGTARAITYGTNYIARGGIALPSTTVINKLMELGFEWNDILGKWNLIALAQEA